MNTHRTYENNDLLVLGDRLGSDRRMKYILSAITESARSRRGLSLRIFRSRKRVHSSSWTGEKYGNLWDPKLAHFWKEHRRCRMFLFQAGWSALCSSSYYATAIPLPYLESSRMYRGLEKQFFLFWIRSKSDYQWFLLFSFLGQARANALSSTIKPTRTCRPTPHFVFNSQMGMRALCQN